jgi:hypothetical protein
MSKLKIAFVSVLLALVASMALFTIERPQALAQDAGQGHNEHKVVFSANANSIALLDTAVTGSSHNIRAMQFSCTASGEVSFYKGNVVSGPNYLGGFGVIANTPCPVPEWILRGGIKSGVGNPIYVVSPNGTLSLFAWVRDDPN